MDKDTIKQAYKRGYENAAVKLAQYFNAGVAQRAASAQRMRGLNQVPHSWDVARTQAGQNYDRIARGNLLNSPVGTIRRMQQGPQPGQQNQQGRQQAGVSSGQPYRPRYTQNGEHTGIYVNGVEWKRGRGQNQPAMMEQQRLSNEDWARDKLSRNPNDTSAQQMLDSTSRLQQEMQRSGMYTPESQRQVGMKQVAPRWNDANIQKALTAYRTAKTSGNADQVAHIQQQFRNYYSSLDPKYQQAFKTHVQGLARTIRPQQGALAQTAQPPKPQVPITPGPVQ